MENQYFNLDDTLYDITEKYKNTIDVFAGNGFPQIKDEEKRLTLGKQLTLRNALSLKKINVERFVTMLLNIIAPTEEKVDVTLKRDCSGSGDINIVGLLPCPVRIPLLEEYNKFIDKFSSKHKLQVKAELKAASMGLSWINDNLKNIQTASELPDIFISAGFDIFFDDALFGRFKKDDVFLNQVCFSGENSLFQGMSMQDIKNHYGIISVVPAVFIVNKNELQGREVPQSWQDILKPEFKNSIALPVQDFDLFNAILLTINKEYGKKGVRALADNFIVSMHPAQMIKSEHNKNIKPTVTIMPYFFTKTVNESNSLCAIWPKDGAIISPIFLLSKNNKKNELKEIIDFFSSKKVGEILAHKGLFPSLHPDVDNKLDNSHNFLWLGWDYIYANDIQKLLRQTENIFYDEAKKVLGL